MSNQKSQPFSNGWGLSKKPPHGSLAQLFFQAPSFHAIRYAPGNRDQHPVVVMVSVGALVADVGSVYTTEHVAAVGALTGDAVNVVPATVSV